MFKLRRNLEPTSSLTIPSQLKRKNKSQNYNIEKYETEPTCGQELWKAGQNEEMKEECHAQSPNKMAAYERIEK